MMTTATAQEPSPSANISPSQPGHWLDEYGEIAAILPVVTGLLITTQLRLRGASALVVNLAIAALTRQLIVQLKKQAGVATPPALAAANHNGVQDSHSQDEDYTIVHQISGRIRLRIPRLLADAVFAQRLEKLLLAQDIVNRVRVNRAASSILNS